VASNTIRFLSADDIKKALSMSQAIDAMRDAFIQLSNKKASVPLRTPIDLDEHEAGALFMPVYLPSTNKFGLKVVSIHKNNPDRGLPMIHALVMVFDSEDGKPLAVIDGEYLTALRTGAASGLATKLLARENSRVAAVFGAGAQGRTQLEAICHVRNIEHVYIFDSDESRAGQFVTEMAQKLHIPIEATKSPKILKDVDIICTATSSSEPVFENSNLKTGVHINGIGSYRPDMCEIPSHTIIKSKLVVDSRESCLSEAGDIIQPIQKSIIKENFIYAELGEIAAGNLPARDNDQEITIFKSVGNAVQDLAAADLILHQSELQNLGTELKL
jgi:ornithine cyclodeaminase/alanine dehydrogenase-like protein (mu-crystallin family)